MIQRIRVTMVDLETNEKVSLTRKEGSRCFFKETFPYKNYEIQLRIDPNEKATGELTLDADIRDKTTNKLLKKEPPWHNTKPETQAGKRTYTFRFENLVKIYFIIETMQIDITSNADLVKEIE